MDAQRLHDFSSLVGLIYDAALDSSAWTETLTRICTFLDADKAVLASYDLRGEVPPWEFGVGYDPYWIDIYMKKYLAMNPYMTEVEQLAAGEVGYMSARPDYEAYLASQLYLEWSQPQQIRDGAVLVIDKSLTSIATLVAVRGTKSLFDDAAMELLHLLYPHLRRSLLIARVLRMHQGQQSDLAAAIDALMAGVLLLTETGEIAHANATAETMLSDRSPVERVNHRLTLPSPISNRALRAALAAAKEGDAELGGKAASLPIAGRDGARFMLHLLPLTLTRRRSIGAEGRAAIIVFIRRSDGADVGAFDTLATQYRLTPQEARIARLIIEVGGIPLVADLLDLSPTTVRSHVTSIFNKTGVRRQADLVKLLMGLQSPFQA